MLSILHAAWMPHVLGAVGGSAALGLALSPLPAIREARLNGNLGGLDTRAFTVFFACNLVGVSYGIKLADIWIFMSTMPSAVVFLHYCLTAIRLLAQEEGEVSQLALPAREHEGGLLFRKDLQMHQQSAKHRQREMRQTEMGLLASIAVAATLCFLGIPETFRFIPDHRMPNVQRLIFDVMQFTMCTLAFAYPLPRLWSLVKRRDASSIFLPLCIGQGINNFTWFCFGVLQMNFALMVPHAFGAVTVLLQLAIVAAFGQKKKEAGQSARDIEAGHGHRESAAKKRNAVRASPQPANTGSQGETSAPAPPTTSMGSQPPTNSTRSIIQGLQRQMSGKVSIGELPDLKPLLRECGVYEEYLQWQRDYQKWRRGGHKGAKSQLVSEAGPELPELESDGSSGNLGRRNSAPPEM